MCRFFLNTMSSKVESLIIKPNIMITYCLTVIPLTPNTWLWLTLNPDFVLNCVLRQHVWSSEAWHVVGELQRKRTLAASRGFLAVARLLVVISFTGVDLRGSNPFFPLIWLVIITTSAKRSLWYIACVCVTVVISGGYRRATMRRELINIWTIHAIPGTRVVDAVEAVQEHHWMSSLISQASPTATRCN